MKILMYYADFSGCGFYRVKQPAKFLSKYFNVETDHSINPDRKADIIVFQRQAEKSYRIAKKLKEDCITVYENDDDLYHLTQTNGAIDYWQPRLEAMTKYVNICDALTVSTKPLGAVYNRLASPRTTKVLPNGIDFDLVKPKVQNKSIILGFAGSASHWRDLEIIMPAILNVLRRNKNVIFHSIGFNGIVKGYGNIYKDLPFGQYRQTKFSDTIEEYYDAIDFDIGLAPNEDTIFNESKSNIKFLEYSAKGAATIASKIIPFNGSIVSGETGLLCKTNGAVVADWERKIQRLIDDQQLRLSMTNNAFNFVFNNFNMKNIVEDYVHFYTMLKNSCKFEV